MSLLRDLQDQAADNKVATAVLLRRVKVLAARVGAPELGEWADKELNGYQDLSELPSYRGPFQAHVLGHFTGPFQSGVRNAPIPPVTFPKEYREGQLFQITFGEPIAELEGLASHDKALESPWPSDGLALTNMLIQQGDVSLYEGMYLSQAWKVITPDQVRGVLDVVRNKILDLALRVEAEFPNAGEDSPRVAPDAGRITNIFNTTVYGHSSNVAVGSSDFDQSTYLSPPSSDDELVDRLAGLGLDDDLLSELRSALIEDRQEAGGDLAEPGPRVTSWLGKITTLGAKAGGKVGAAASASIIAKLVLSYFGIQ